jgi:serine/threonine protein kinase
MAPEYAFDGQFSTKSDVFSFGILMLEIISEKRSRGFYHPDHNHNLIGSVSFKRLDFFIEICWRDE